MFRRFWPPQLGMGALALAAAFAVGCHDEPDPVVVSDAGPPPIGTLVADEETVVVKPGEAHDLAFRLLDGRNEGLPGHQIRVVIIDDPRTEVDDAQGATLSTDLRTTDSQGRTKVVLTAGLETRFRVRATSPGAVHTDLVVVVSNGTQVAAEIAPKVESDDPSVAITTVRLYRYDRESCAAHTPVPANPQESEWPVRTLPLDAIAPYAGFSADDIHAIVGIGLDAQLRVRVAGCVDLPGQVLLIQEPLRVLLPLRPFRPVFPPALKVASRFALRDPLRVPKTLADPWRTLSACPLDPAQLWLDCTVDALGPADAKDPLDCRPRADEGTIGSRIVARRGAAAGACRARTDLAGRPSLESSLAALFPNPAPPALGQLTAVANELDALLDDVRIESTLQVAPSTVDGRLALTHALRQIAFGTAAPFSIASVGAPALEARSVSGTIARDELTVGPHGVSLRLGSLARVAFGRTSLGPRGAPADATKFVAHLFGLPRGKGMATGCTALDDVVCTDLGLSAGCVLTACQDGLVALAKTLDAGFVALDGDGLDFTLTGTAPIIDDDRDGKADALGRSSSSAVSPGIWSGTFRLKSGDVGVTGSWTADKP